MAFMCSEYDQAGLLVKEKAPLEDSEVVGLQVLTDPRLLAGLLVGKSELKSWVRRAPANGAGMSCGVSK